MTMERAELGRRGEERAARYLKKKGYRIVTKNFRCRGGEVDIVALDGRTVVFVEVKTRSSRAYGPPKLAVDERKQRQIERAALTYLSEKGLFDRASTRFDVVGIDVRGDSDEVEHIINAFDMKE